MKKKIKIVIAPDSFKGSIDAHGAAEALEKGILSVADAESVEIVKVPIADGGEGTVEALAAGLGGSLVSIEVCGPLMNSLNSTKPSFTVLLRWMT